MKEGSLEIFENPENPEIILKIYRRNTKESYKILKILKNPEKYEKSLTFLENSK